MQICRLGIDIGSTTLKVVLLDEFGKELYSDYRRHFARIKETLVDTLKDIRVSFKDAAVSPCICGSGGMALATSLGIPFVQELICVSKAVESKAPDTNVAIELGGEDAKIVYFENGGIEQRMNGICAGGTGAFIDQMAALLNTDASGLNEYAKDYEAIYPIAARCGVFAKSDIQPLINDGAKKQDLAASIFTAVCKQTIGGLACGKPIKGHVTFLGGPLHFLDQLRFHFERMLGLDEAHSHNPEGSHLFAALGAAHYADSNALSIDALLAKMGAMRELKTENLRLNPLFNDKDELIAFKNRHAASKVNTFDIADYKGPAFLGIDAGSTTAKLCLISKNADVLFTHYSSNKSDPIETVKEALDKLYSELPDDVYIANSLSTGYGESLMKCAFDLDDGEVETVCHYTGGSYFSPSLDTIIDIGGQDMKCMRVKDGAVVDVQLNEACSSGCGSFIESFAQSLGYDVRDFAKEAVQASAPIDLGSRCTVFMNSKVKQAQKEGASVADISAGLSYSVVKNALYKVMKISDPSELGNTIVVQGGTLLNDSVLKALERTVEKEVIRPDIAGLMGAFGAALLAKNRWKTGRSSILPRESLNALKYSNKQSVCGLCNNNCTLTISTFDKKRRHISGNRCERPTGAQGKHKCAYPNIFDYKREKLFSYSQGKDRHFVSKIGLPRVLSFYENYPFWFTFFDDLDVEVVLSPKSSSKLYEMGLESIPSESTCYPAKLVHGHIKWLLENGANTVFYPCISYEHTEFKTADNHYNCPIVSTYSENIKNNMEDFKDKDKTLIMPFLSFESEKVLSKRLVQVFSHMFKPRHIRRAVTRAWAEFMNYKAGVRKAGEAALEFIEKQDAIGIVLAGRPYHLDEGINHGIPEMINSYGVAVLSEDSIAHLEDAGKLRVLDQWMYHSRLYRAAEMVKTHPNLEMVQLNSFGCGLDAVTQSQVADILAQGGKLHSVLKIDEISNLGAARIRIRSLLAHINEKKNNRRGRDDAKEKQRNSRLQNISSADVAHTF